MLRTFNCNFHFIFLQKGSTGFALLEKFSDRVHWSAGCYSLVD